MKIPEASRDLKIINSVNNNNNKNPTIPSYICIRSKIGLALLLNFYNSDCNIRLYTDVIPK